MKRNISKFLCAAMLATCLAGVVDTSAAQRQFSVMKGTTVDCLPKYSKGDNIKYTYEVTDTNVATIDKDTGVISGINTGATTVKVKRVKDGKSATATYKLSVCEFKITKGDDKLAVGEKVNYGSSVDTGVVWKSSDENVIRVSSTGEVTAIGVGKATVLAIYQNSVDTRNVVVHASSTDTFKFTSTTSALAVGNSTKIITTKDATFTTSNTNVAKVDKDGVVTAVGVGEVTIYASYNGQSISTKINVYKSDNPVTNNTQSVLKVGETMQYTTSMPGAKWYSSNPSVVSINTDTGLAKANSVGTVALYAVAGNQTTVTTVSVVNDNTGGLAFLDIQDKYVAGTMAFVKANKTGVSWFSSDPNIISVDANTGLLSAKTLGNAVLYCVHDGKMISKAVSVVEKSISGNQIYAQKNVLKKGESVLLTSTSKVEWVSNNTDIVKVDRTTGLVTAVNEGAAVVYAVSADGSVAFVQITVIKSELTEMQKTVVNDANVKIQALLGNVDVTFSNTSLVKTYLERCKEALDLCITHGLKYDDVLLYKTYKTVLDKYLTVETEGHKVGAVSLATQKQLDLAAIDVAINTWFMSTDKTSTVSTIDTMISNAKAKYMLEVSEISKIVEYNTVRKSLGLTEIK